MSDWLPQTQQLLALTSYLTVLTHTLRAKGVLSKAEIERLLHLAEDLLPPEAQQHGAFVLETIRSGYVTEAGEEGSSRPDGSNVSPFPPTHP